jgi:hypothetical protein
MSNLNSEILQKMNLKVDLERLNSEMKNLIDKVGWDEKTNQISLTHSEKCVSGNEFREGNGSLYDFKADVFLAQESDFNILNSQLSKSYAAEILSQLPFRYARVRLMKLNPKRCLSIHEDTGPRYHLALITNPDVYFVFPKDNSLLQVPADGFLYKMDTTRFHTVFNGSLNHERIHLVISDRDNC